MRKIAYLILLLTLLVAVLSVQAQDAEIVTYTAGDWDYIENQTGITLTAWSGKAIELQIPSELDGKTVTQLGRDLFKSNRDLRTVFIPEGVTTIGQNAFYGCESLKNVSLPNTLTKIDNSVFRYCTSLESIHIPFSVTSIGAFSFSDCVKLRSVNLLAVTSIGESAFDNCQQLEEVMLSRKLTTVNGYAFRDTPWLEAQTDEYVIIGKGVLLKWNGAGTHVEVPYGVTMISDAFADCYFLEEVVLPDTVTNIGQYAFRDAINLRSVTFPQYLTTIGANAFNGCRSLSEIELPSTVKTLGGSAFRNCNSLKQVIIPPLVTSLADGTFADNPSLTEVLIPAAVTSVHKNTFLNSPNVQLQVASGSAAEDFAVEYEIPYSYAKRVNNEFIYSIDENGAQIDRYIGKMYDVEVPAVLDGEAVTAIGPGAFQNNARVRRVIVPITVKTIGDWAFSYMDSLEAVQLPAGLSSLGANAFTGSLELRQVRMPKALETIGEKPFATDVNTTICAAENSYAEKTLSGWGYTVRPEDACAADEETMALWASLNLLDSSAADTCECPPRWNETAPDGESEEIAVQGAHPDIEIVEIPNQVTYVDSELLRGTGRNLLLIIPASVTTIDESILTGRTITIVSKSGTAAEAFAREHGIKFLVQFTTLQTYIRGGGTE